MEGQEKKEGRLGDERLTCLTRLTGRTDVLVLEYHALPPVLNVGVLVQPRRRGFSHATPPFGRPRRTRRDGR